jgi:hypothetical protein
MSARAFAELAREERPGLAPLLLAAAGEFGPVDRAGARVELDRMAARLHRWVNEQGTATADAIAQLLVERRIRPSSRVGPADAMLDRVIMRGRGHPALIAAICVEAGARAGLPLAPAGTDEEIFVGVRNDTGDGPSTLIIDPAGALAGPLPGMSWRCSHEVCFIALSKLSRLFCLTGDIAGALRAAELRAELPVAPRVAGQLAFEADALRANLN